jgi:1-acyl-sn-glycerol-3-phosphate acyltransferase
MWKFQELLVDHLKKDRLSNKSYSHARLEKKRRFLRFLIRYIGFNVWIKLEQVVGLENIPKEGPAVLMMNHIAFLDPIVVLHATPRNIVPLAKIEVYDYPVIGIFPKMWEVIPVRRQEVDRRAIQQALEVLQAGEIVLVAPEGTRGPQLRQGKEGAAYLASRSGAPIIPAAVTNTTGFPAWRFTSRWRKPGAYVEFGRPFRYRPGYERAGREQLRLMSDEAMFVLAAMLPENLRGYYSDLSQATQETIDWC